MSISKAHKLNTEGSTKAELVGVYDALPDTLWGKYFVEAQGYVIKHNVLLQDNNRTLSMEGYCLDRLRKIVNVRNFYGNGGGYDHQSNDTVREFYLHLSYSKLQKATTTTSHLYTFLARMFEKNG